MEKEILDKENILKIIQTLFVALPVNMIVEKKSVPVHIVAIKPQGLVISKIPERMDSSLRILTLTNNGSLFIGQFTAVGGDSQYEILQPLKMNVRLASRNRPRLEIKNKFNVYITNIINISDISSSLIGDTFSIGNILKTHISKLKVKYEYANIVASDRLDNRARIMYNYNSPVFVPNAKNESSVSDKFVPYKEYYMLTKGNKSDKFVGDISVPIKYRNITPIGYVHIMHSEELTVDDFNTVSLTAAAVRRDLVSAEIFSEIKDHCELVDISYDGFAVIYPSNRSFSRIFTQGANILVDIVFTEEQKYTVRAVVRNIKSQEKDFRAGCQFYSQSPEEIQGIVDFLKAQNVSEEVSQSVE